MAIDFAYLALKLSGPRGLGQTHALATLAKREGATVLCANRMHAIEVARVYGVRTRAIDECLRGLDEPMVLDHSAAGTLLYMAGAEVEHQRADLTSLRAEVARLAGEVEGLRSVERAARTLTSAARTGVGSITSAAAASLDDALAKTQPTPPPLSPWVCGCCLRPLDADDAACPDCGPVGDRTKPHTHTPHPFPTPPPEPVVGTERKPTIGLRPALPGERSCGECSRRLTDCPCIDGTGEGPFPEDDVECLDYFTPIAPPVSP
jgi:hypothetical protein